MNYVYLDQNIIDRIDKGLKDKIVKFLEKNRLNPIISIVSLLEIERGKQIERTFATIQALIDIGSSIIYEENSEMLIIKITRIDKIFELMLRKDYLIFEITRCLHIIQFYETICTSRNELKKFLAEPLNKLQYLIGKMDETYSQKTKNDLLSEIDISNDLINQMPEKYDFITDIRSTISLIPKEINNLNLKDLWGKIEFLCNNGLLDFDLSNENPKVRLYNHLLMLNIIGYWCDDINKEKKQVAFEYDCMHGIYGCLCHSIVSSDKRFLKRLKAAYYHLSIQTKIFHLSGNVFNELD